MAVLPLAKLKPNDTWAQPEATGPTHHSTYTLAEENGGTRLTITYSIREFDTQEQWMFQEQSAVGFGMMIANVRAVVEGTNLPYPDGF